jgi:oligopeptidase B
VKPPVAAIVPHVLASPHGNRTDNYFWLRDDTRSKKEVLDYLNAENAYAKAMTAHTDALQKTLYEEMVARLKQDDASVPWRKHGYWYYRRFETGKEYPIVARRKDVDGAPEEILLDGNAMGAGKGYFQIGATAISDDGSKLAYQTDEVGRRQYTMRFRDLSTGKDYPEQITGLSAQVYFAADNKTVLYVENDAQTLLSERVKKHVLGTDPKTDPVVYEERDNTFYLGIGKGRSDRHLYIVLSSTVSTEFWMADARDPQLQFQPVLKRERDHEYEVQDHGDELIVLSNWKATNFRILRAPMKSASDRGTWREWVAHREDALIEGMEVTRDWVAIQERSGGLMRVRIKYFADDREELLDFAEPSYVTYLGAIPEYETDTLRFLYSSLTTPTTTYDQNLKTGVRELKKREPVLGNFDPANYVSELVWAPARDGTRIPVSLMYRKGRARDGKGAMFQIGYGSYGSSYDPSFTSTVLSAADRGVLYAIAHIRGGEEMGRRWYEQGRQQHKINTFTDFIDVTDFLVAQGYAAKDRVAAQGGSAGGLLMGAVANMAPDRYRAMVADVPFVDVVSTMMDASLPLTTNEYDEWGNPADKAAYDYMLSYSPYDQVKAQAYPAMLVTTGLHDSQVQYFEPAKWVAKLRATRTDQNPLYLFTEMEAGHGGKSGRFQRYNEIARMYAFVLDQLGVAK